MSVTTKANSGERAATKGLIGRLIILDEKLWEGRSQRLAIERSGEMSQGLTYIADR